jgi:mono/diheme cytochrome c family protein
VRNFLWGAILTLSVVIIGGLAYLRFGFAEVRGDLPPGRWERAFMFSSVHASVRRHAPELPNPVPLTDENLIAGGRMYVNECSGCHGAPGKPEESGDSLYPPVPQLAIHETSLTEAQIFWVAKHGIRLSGMFANGKWDSDQKLWTVAAYIKRISSLPQHVRDELAKPPAK